MSFQSNWVCESILLLIVIVGLIAIFKQRKLLVRYKDDEINSEDLKRRYTELIHLLPQTMIELDSEGRIVFLNEVGYKFLGLSKYDIEKGIYFSSLLNEHQRPRFQEDILYVLEGGLNKGQEYLIKTNDDDFAVSIYFSPIEKKNDQKGINGIIIDISKRKKLERKAFQAVIETEERERKRYSEDLHDGLGPLLSTVKLYMNQMITEKMKQVERDRMLTFVNDLIDEAISTTRTIANNILPTSIADNGLWAAIESFCQNIEQTGAIKFELVNNTNFKFKKKAENNIYRIIIELINNTIKHAHAKNIKISIEMLNENIRIIYSDDGIGIGENNKKGLGLSNIKNRSSSLNGQYWFSNSNGMRFELLLSINVISKNK